MPGQSGSGIRGIPWARCDRCGWDYPLDKLVMQNGLLLCQTKCYDDPLIFTRDQVMEEVISEGGDEAENITARKRAEPNITDQKP